jgi:hypothetical protein
MLIKICQSLFRAGLWRYSRSCRMKRKKSGNITGRCRTGRVTEKPFRTVEWLKTPDSKRVADSHFGASLPTPATRVKYSRQLARCQSYVTDKPIRRADRPRRIGHGSQLEYKTAPGMLFRATGGVTRHSDRIHLGVSGGIVVANYAIPTFSQNLSVTNNHRTERAAGLAHHPRLPHQLNGLPHIIAILIGKLRRWFVAVFRLLGECLVPIHLRTHHGDGCA